MKSLRIITHAFGAPFEKLWGDYWVAFHLRKAFESLGCKVYEINDNNTKVDFNIYLVGEPFDLNKFPAHKHIAWFYSHIYETVINHLNNYDLVMCLSPLFINSLKIKPLVVPLIGCTHIIPFKNIPNKVKEIVMCSNAKIEEEPLYGRTILKELDCLKNNFDLALYGLDWEKLSLMKSYYKGNYWNNEKLDELYKNFKIGLNDAYLGMNENGFVTIRTYDIVASGTLCVSSKVKGLEDIFEDCVVTYANTKDLQQKVKFYLNNDEERNKKILKGLKLIKEKKMNYVERAKQILGFL